jgi:hypothetical protein
VLTEIIKLDLNLFLIFFWSPKSNLGLITNQKENEKKNFELGEPEQEQEEQ